MKILVTGVNGFVGQHLARELQANQHTVVGIGGPSGAKETTNLESYHELDLTQADQIMQINYTGIDAVIHLAGLAAVGPSFEEPVRYVATNMGAEINLFEAAIKQKSTPRFLVISSGNLYDPTATMPLSETSAVSASSPYAVSKLGQEQLAAYYSLRGFDTLVARPFNHIGPGQGLGFIVPDLAQQIVAVERGDSAEIKVGNLDAERDYTDVRDIVRAYRFLVEKGKAGETYNVCSGKPLSGHQILEGLLKASDTSPVVSQDPARMRPSDSPVLYGSASKLTQDTGWTPSIPLEDTFSDVIADWRSK